MFSIKIRVRPGTAVTTPSENMFEKTKQKQKQKQNKTKNRSREQRLNDHETPLRIVKIMFMEV